MKRINKQESPQWFEDWKRNFKAENNRNAHYKNDFSADQDLSYENLLASCNGEGTMAAVPDETPNADTLEAFAELENGGGHKFSGTTEQLFAELMED